MNGIRNRGQCEGCDKEPRILTRIQSGQLVCRTCLREIRTPPAGQLARLEDIRQLRTRGFEISDDLTQGECERLQMVDLLRSHGLSISLDISCKDVKRLTKWLGLRSRRSQAHMVA